MRSDVYAEDTHSHPHNGIHNLFAAYFLASPLIFRCISVDFFAVSSAFPWERLLNFFAFYFSGIRVDFSCFTLYFGDIWLCIPFGTIFEQKTYNSLP
jgi:hypothetical protein